MVNTEGMYQGYNVEGSAEIKVTPDKGYTQWSEEYIIPRSDGLRDAGTYCFLLEAINNDGREQVLLNDNHDVVHFWLQLSQNEPNY